MLGLCQLKIALASALCHRVMGDFLARVFRDNIPSHGLRIDVRNPEIVPSTKAKIFWGFYESAERRFVNMYVDDKLDVIELGASIGVISSHIARKLEGKRLLICVEANPELCGDLVNNVKSNAPATNVVTLSRAVAYGQSYAILQVGTETTSSKTDGAQDDGDNLRVPTIRLGDILQKYEVDEYCLVVDIEGAEHVMLLEDADALRRCRMMIIELHESEGPMQLGSIRCTANYIESVLGFRVVEHYGPVYVFDRPE